MIDFVAIDKTREPLLEQICQRIRRLQNWGSIESLKHLGVDSTKQVGASYLSLKELASCYEKDMRLAQMLWYKARREEQIVAEFLLPSDVELEYIYQMLEHCINQEVAEYFGSIVLANHTHITEIFQYLIENKNPYWKIAALTGGARHIMLHKTKSLLNIQYYQEIIDRKFSDRYVQLVANRYKKNVSNC